MASIAIKLISPGMGSSGFYPAETLKQAASDNVFGRGTQMFWVDNAQHGSGVEDPARLAAVLETNAEWQENGRDGAGLYAVANVFSDYEKLVMEKGKHIGLSIVGSGDVTEGDLPDGKRGRVIKRISKGQSVDFVTKAGRDGKVLLESATIPDGETRIIETAIVAEEKNDMTEQIKEAAVAEARVAVLEAEAVKLRDENQRLRAELQLHEAKRVATSAWQDDQYSRIPAKVKALFEGAALAQMPMLDGKVDAAKLLTLVQESADEYIQHLPTAPVGVTGNDSTPTNSLEESRQKQIEKLMADYKLTEAQARKAYGA
jgi:hypothetical protein